MHSDTEHNLVTPSPPGATPRQAGMTLLEVVVALAVTTTVVAGGAAVFRHVTKSGVHQKAMSGRYRAEESLSRLLSTRTLDVVSASRATCPDLDACVSSGCPGSPSAWLSSCQFLSPLGSNQVIMGSQANPLMLDAEGGPCASGKSCRFAVVGSFRDNGANLELSYAITDLATSSDPMKIKLNAVKGPSSYTIALAALSLSCGANQMVSGFDINGNVTCQTAIPDSACATFAIGRNPSGSLICY